MKRAIVLSGGGAKGGYEIGVWKALRELKIDYDIVTGTSVGALNGVLMVQKDFYKALKFWYYMDYTKVIDVEIKGKFSTSKGKSEILKKYAKGMVHGGYEMSGLQGVIDEAYDEDKFYNSSIKFGLVTTYFPSLKPKLVTKDKLDRLLAKDYIMASASCFPAFKAKKIKNASFIDGGYYDNLPINLAIDLGADEVIAVDLGAVGLSKKPKKNIPTTLITPNNDLGSFLAFEKDYARMAINFGYNDCLKKYNKLEGNIYTFKKGSLKRNYDRNSSRFHSLLNKYIDNNMNKSLYKKIAGKNKEAEFNKILEETLKAFDIDQSKIYRTSLANIMIKKRFVKSELKSYNTIKAAIKNNKLKKIFVSKELICYIYNEIKKDKEKNRVLNNLKTLFPNAFLCALYIKSIMR